MAEQDKTKTRKRLRLILWAAMILFFQDFARRINSGDISRLPLETAWDFAYYGITLFQHLFVVSALIYSYTVFRDNGQV